MTDLRTFPPDFIVEKRGTLTKNNFCINHITRPLAYYNSGGNISNYGFRPSYNNTGVGKTVWDGARKFKQACLADNNNIAITYGASPDATGTYAGWFRSFYPNSVQLYEQGTGLHTGVLADLLDSFDFAYLRGAKMIWSGGGFFNRSSKLSNVAFGHTLQCSSAYETNVLAFLNALFDSTQTSTLGFTVANHPGFGAIEAGSENAETENDNQTTDQAGNIHANILRMIHGVIKTKEVIVGVKTEGIKILGYAGHGAESTYYLDIWGADSRSQASTNLGTATLDSATDILSLASHPLENWEQVLCEAVDFLDTYTQYTDYYVINKTANTFQLSATSGGAAVTASTVNGIMDVFTNSSPTTNNTYYDIKNANICTYDFATNTFTQTAHLLTDGWKVKLVGRIGTTASDSGVSAYRRYWVRDVVAGVSFKIATTLNGAALNSTQNANVRVRRNVPATLNGDTGVNVHPSSYIDALNHHFYVNGTTYYTTASNRIVHEKLQNTHVYSLFVPFEIYRKFGKWNRGIVTRSGNTLTSMFNLNLKATTRLQFQGTALMGGLARDQYYYPVNINNAAKTFEVSLTQGGSTVTLTSAGTGVAVNILHDWFGREKIPAIWNTESNLNESVTATYITQSLNYEKRKDLMRHFILAKLIATSDGSGGFGVDTSYGFEEGNSTIQIYTATIGTVNGHLKVTFSSAPTTPSLNEQITLLTNANAIAGVLAANSEQAFNILNIISSTEFELDVAYTGGAVADVQCVAERWLHNGAREFREIVTELTQDELTVGRCTVDSNGYLGIAYAIKNVGCWYYDSTGTRKQW